MRTNDFARRAIPPIGSSRWLAALVLLLSLLGCGGGGGGDEQGGGASLLAGDAQAKALAVLPSVAPVRASPGDIAAGGELLTRLSVVLRLDATVDDVNAAARAVGATGFALARPKSPFITMIVPRQADATALKALAAQLQGRPGILHAAPARQLQAKELPNAGGQTADVSELDHLLATRFPAAWNARRAAEVNCAGRTVTLIVPDFYFGSPSAFASQTEGAVSFEGVPLEPLAGQTGDAHGYEVVATLTAKFDELLSHGANPSPTCLQIHTVDAGGLDAAGLIDQLSSAIAAEPGPVIVSSSVGYKVRDNELLCPGGCAELPAAFDASARQFIAEAFLDGIHWASFAMQPSFVDRVLIVQAAGNDANVQPGLSYPGFSDARLNSPIAIASVLGELETIANDAARWAPPGLPSLVLDAGVVRTLKDLRDALVPAAPTARNLTIVGSATNQPLLVNVQRSSFSNLGADLFAVGEGVSTIDLLVKEGTSFSAPQVAGLASILWLLDDGLRTQPVEQTLALIRASSGSSPQLGGVIDAYAAVLAIDARRQRLDVRKALLDVNGDGVFDHLDLQVFMQAYAVEPTGRDYSRFDLNGDGTTGGIGIAPFDLDVGALAANGSAQINSPTLPIEGYDVQMNEGALSDLQILCYYAHVADTNGAPLLYDSRTEAIAERTRLLGPDRCVGVRLDVQLPARIDASTGLTATVRVPTGNGQFSPGANLLVQLAANCATVSPSQATSAADGSISASVTPSAGCTSISVDVTVRASAGGNALARKTVSASVGASGVYLFLGTADFLFGVPGVHLMAPLSSATTQVNLRQADGSLSGCGITNQACLAHWDAGGGTMIDGRPDGTSIGRVGTYTAGPTFGRFEITATSTTGEFPTTTDVMLIGPVGNFSVHACTFSADESAAICADSGTVFATVGPFDTTGVERYALSDTSRLSRVPFVLVFDVIDGKLANFKSFNIRDGLVDTTVHGFIITEVSVDTEHVRFLISTQGGFSEHTRVTLSRP